MYLTYFYQTPKIVFYLLFTCGTALQDILIPPEEEPEPFREDDAEEPLIARRRSGERQHVDLENEGQRVGDERPPGQTRNPVVLSLAALLRKIFVNKKLTCSANMEIPYYSVKTYLPVCFYCGQDEDLLELGENNYPLCETCNTAKNRTEVKKRKRNLVTEKQKKKNAAASREAASNRDDLEGRRCEDI